jgi:hypothetical protein
MIGNIQHLCSPTITQRFTCNGAKVVYNASITWRSIGPQKMFQSGQVYSGIMYFFIIGVRCGLLQESVMNFTDFCVVACSDCLGLPALSKISQQLGPLY